MALPRRFLAVSDTGFGSCGAVLALTPDPVLEVGNAQSVPIFPLLLKLLFTVVRMTPIE